MTGFAPDWLALREPVDHTSISHPIRTEALRYLAGRDPVAIIDLGCGTGSNFRGLAREIEGRQSWTLVDHDKALLDRAKTLTADLADTRNIAVSCREADLAGDDIADLVAGNDLVTASALFDLISEQRIEEIADAIAKTRAAFYTVLTYDGIAAWLPETPLAATLRQAFNRHQQTDKGFGPAAGPDATRALKRAFLAHGYSVTCAPSPWILDDSAIELRRETDRGWVAAVVEADGLTLEEGETFLDGRANDPDAVTIVGHSDLLALPPNA